MPGIEPYRHFGLSAPPFDGRPDPRFYYATAAHAETLATLQYAVRTRKTCTLVLGDSGSGKTLLGRLLARSIAGQTGIVWVHGLGQPDNRTDATLCPANRLARADPFGPTNARETTLSDWLRIDPGAAQAGVVVVDNADGLRPHNWEDILSLVTREIRPVRPIALLLFGLPALVDTLAGQNLLRLQRRVFRACRLNPLTRADVDGYVPHRLRMAAAPMTAGTVPPVAKPIAPAEVFTAAALDLVHRFSEGNPALLNQLCDNALVDAFADDRTQIDGRHIVATIHAITGGIRSRRYLPSPPAGGESAFAATRLAGGVTGPMVTAACRAESRLRRLSSQRGRATVDLTDLIGEPYRRAPDAPDGPGGDDPFLTTAADSPGPNTEHSDDPSVAGESPANGTPGAAPTDPAASAPPLDQRLRALEGRLADALARVREARRRPYILPPPPLRNDPWPDPSTVEPHSAGVTPLGSEDDLA